MVVLPDADVELAADSAVSAAYGSAGERCMAISVVAAVGDVADSLVEAIKLRMEKLVIGDGTDPASDMGPLITREHRDRVAGYVGSAAEQGATVVVDGRDTRFDADGFFLGVSLLDNVTTEMDAYRDEIFGPVLSVVRCDTYAEAVQLIADNPWGNGAAIFTRDGGRGPPVPRGRRRGHGGHQRPDTRAGGIPLLRRLEGLPVRRHHDVRPRGDPLLHQAQGHDRSLARSRHQLSGPGLSDQ